MSHLSGSLTNVVRARPGPARAGACSAPHQPHGSVRSLRSPHAAVSGSLRLRPRCVYGLAPSARCLRPRAVSGLAQSPPRSTRHHMCGVVYSGLLSATLGRHAPSTRPLRVYTTATHMVATSLHYTPPAARASRSRVGSGRMAARCRCAPWAAAARRWGCLRPARPLLVPPRALKLQAPAAPKTRKRGAVPLGCKGILPTKRQSGHGHRGAGPPSWPAHPFLRGAPP